MNLKTVGLYRRFFYAETVAVLVFFHVFLVE